MDGYSEHPETNNNLATGLANVKSLKYSVRYGWALARPETMCQFTTLGTHPPLPCGWLCEQPETQRRNAGK
jgi:hypothetical protein